MVNDITKDAETRMKKSMEALQAELSKMRTGRAHPSFLDHIKVVYYENVTPLSQVATVAIENSRTLTVTPWEASMVQTVEKAIRDANLGLNPAAAGNVIRVPLPALTEERRKEMIRVVKEEVEKARVAIRNIRRDANNDFKDLLKAKDISEDDDRRAQGNVQKLTDRFIEEVDKMMGKKEAELMEV